MGRPVLVLLALSAACSVDQRTLESSGAESGTPAQDAATETVRDVSLTADAVADSSLDAGVHREDAADGAQDISVSPPAGDAAATDSPPGNRDAPTIDAIGPDTAITDAGADSIENPAVAEAGNFTDPGSWQTMSVGLASGTAGAGSYNGVAFDGRYVYFAPSGTTSMLRYDITQPFTVSMSWATFDLSAVDPGAYGFAGAVYDGRYLYFVPSISTKGKVVVQCDTTAPGGCLSRSSWSSFSLGAIDDAGTWFEGALFDGRYVSLMPYVPAAGSGVDSTLARFDRQAPGGLSSSASWSTFQIGLAVPNATTFWGGLFDDRRIYFIPAFSGLLAIYDTTLVVNDSTAWSSLDLSLVKDGGIAQFSTGAFDGRYIYLAPEGTGGDVLRCDTKAASSCSTTAPWTRFNVSPLDPGDAGVGGFVGATFDGRYVYFAPSASPIAVRVDTTATFTDRASWSSFDLARLNIASKGFLGAAFDGEYVYLAPYGSNFIVRFDARKPPAPPGAPTWGSFY